MKTRILSIILSCVMLLTVSVAFAGSASAAVVIYTVDSYVDYDYITEIRFNADPGAFYQTINSGASEVFGLAIDIFEDYITSLETMTDQKVMGVSVNGEQVFAINNIDAIAGTADIDIDFEAAKKVVIENMISFAELSTVNSTDFIRDIEVVVTFSGDGDVPAHVKVGFFGDTSTLNVRAAELEATVPTYLVNNGTNNVFTTNFDIPSLVEVFDELIVNEGIATEGAAAARILSMTVGDFVNLMKAQPTTKMINGTAANAIYDRIPARFYGKTLAQFGLSYVADGNFVLNKSVSRDIDNYNFARSSSISYMGITIDIAASAVINETITVNTSAAGKLFSTPIVVNNEPVFSVGAKINTETIALRLGAKYVKANLVALGKTAAQVDDMGMILYPTHLLGDSELTHATVGAISASALNIEGYDPEKTFVDYDEFIFYVTIAGVPVNGLNTDISFRPFYDAGDGYVYARDTMARSYSYVKGIVYPVIGSTEDPIPATGDNTIIANPAWFS